jgi:hypothetical protein
MAKITCKQPDLKEAPSELSFDGVVPIAITVTTYGITLCFGHSFGPLWKWESPFPLKARWSIELTESELPRLFLGPHGPPVDCHAMLLEGKPVQEIVHNGATMIQIRAQRREKDTQSCDVFIDLIPSKPQ